MGCIDAVEELGHEGQGFRRMEHLTRAIPQGNEKGDPIGGLAKLTPEQLTSAPGKVMIHLDVVTEPFLQSSLIVLRKHRRYAPSTGITTGRKAKHIQ